MGENKHKKIRYILKAQLHSLKLFNGNLLDTWSKQIQNNVKHALISMAINTFSLLTLLTYSQAVGLHLVLIGQQ